MLCRISCATDALICGIMRGVEGSAPMNAMTLAELIVIDPYFADCVLPLVHVGASLNHLGKKCFAFSSLDKSNIPDILAKI